jgi:hypothetical protein
VTSLRSVPRRGDGVGIEVTRDVIRGVRLDSSTPDRLLAAAEVPITVSADDRSTVDSLVRLRAELGDPTAPTRVALFPAGGTLARVDATGLTGTDLQRLRSDLVSSRSASSSVLVDDGPRRWLIGVSWDDAEIRRIEDLTERAGFVDVAVDPSPLALARVLDADVTLVRRNASTDRSFAMMVSHGVVVAAASLDAIGRTTPSLACSETPVAEGWFDEITEPAELAVEMRRLVDDASPVAWMLDLAGTTYPDFPPHDLRSPQRQCVALGAAVGAAGLTGRLRPVDVVLPATTTHDVEHPWAIERVSNLPTTNDTASVGPTKRIVAKLLPRRR